MGTDAGRIMGKDYETSGSHSTGNEGMTLNTAAGAILCRGRSN